MAIVKPNLHRLNRSQCFCWGPTRPGNERGCVEAGSARLSVIRHRATLAGKRMERPLPVGLSTYTNTLNISNYIHLFLFYFMNRTLQNL